MGSPVGDAVGEGEGGLLGDGVGDTLSFGNSQQKKEKKEKDNKHMHTHTYHTLTHRQAK